MCREDKAALWKYKLFLQKNSERSKVRARGQRPMENACLFFLVVQQKATSHGIGIWVLGTGFPQAQEGTRAATQAPILSAKDHTWRGLCLECQAGTGTALRCLLHAEQRPPEPVSLLLSSAVLWPEDPGSGSLDTPPPHSLSHGIWMAGSNSVSGVS